MHKVTQQMFIALIILIFMSSSISSGITLLSLSPLNPHSKYIFIISGSTLLSIGSIIFFYEIIFIHLFVQTVHLSFYKILFLAFLIVTTIIGFGGTFSGITLLAVSSQTHQKQTKQKQIISGSVLLSFGAILASFILFQFIKSNQLQIQSHTNQTFL